METRSGDLLSGALCTSVAVSFWTAPETSAVFKVFDDANAMPEWAFIALVCGIFCMFASFCKNRKVLALARMMSGSIWGSIILLFGAEGKFFPLFCMALVMFSFDIYSVLNKGKVSWIRRSNS